MTFPKRIGFFSKLLSLTILTIVVVIAITTGFAIKQQGALLTSSLIQGNTSLTLVVSSQIEAGYLSQRWPFESLKMVSEDENVLYWWVVKPSGQVHLASSPDMWGKTITNSAVGTRELLVKDDLLPETGEKIKVIVNPLKIEGEGTPWTFWLGLSLRPIAAAKKRMILTNVAVGLLIIAIGVFLSFLLMRSTTRPIRALVNGTKAVAKGELGHQISITTKDELGELAFSFNEMSAALKQVKVEEDRRIKQLTALNRASQTVNVTLELDQVLAKIVSLASKTVGADYTSVILVDEANHIHRKTENLPGVPSIEYHIRDEGFTSWIMRSGQAVIIDEIGEDGAINSDLDEGAPRFANPYMVKVGVKSVASLPLRVRDRLLGVVYFHSLHAGTFHGQLSLLVTFVNQIAIAVENARLYGKVQQELTERKAAEEAIQHLVEFERLIAAVSTNFINLTLDKIDDEINQALQTTGEFSGVDRSYVFLFSEDGTKMDNTHEWCAEGIEPQIDNLKGLPVELSPWWMDKLNQFENVYIPRVADLPPEASTVKEILQPQGIQSLIVVPMVYGGSLIGYLGFDSVRTEKRWSEEDIALLKIVGEIFVSALKHKQAEEALRLSFIQLAETVSRAMESQDPYTAGHQRQVAELARMVGEKLGLEPDRLQGIYIAGLLHDIGKISIPAEILTHPGKLSDAEWALIRTHPRRGYEILEQVEFPWPVADITLHHHERLDGTGYPDGIKGNELSLEVRILGVCDVVDALSSDRPYRPARPKEMVVEELLSGKGTKYDEKVVDIMLEILEDGTATG